MGLRSVGTLWTSPPPPPPPEGLFDEPASIRNAIPTRAAPIARGTLSQGAFPGQPRTTSQPLPRRSSRPYDITSGAYRPHGPVEIRDEWLLAQPRMTLPAMSPDPIPVGQWRAHLYINRGNDFGFDQSGPAEMPTDRRFLVDGEHQTTAADVRYGLSNAFSVGARLPIHWRGGGFMDGFIDWFHELTEPLGTLDNARPAFKNDQYRVEGRDAAFNAISWNDEQGTGLGRLELNAQWNVLRPCRRCDWRAAVVTRVSLPTASGPFTVDGIEVGLQATVAKQVGARWDLYGGVGGTWFSDNEVDGVLYEDFRAFGFCAVEYHVGRSVSLILEFDGASRLVTNLVAYPALSSYVNLSCRWDISCRSELEIGFTENIADQQGTIDFGAFAGFTYRF